MDKHDYRTTTRNKEPRESDASQKRTALRRLNEPRENFSWEDEIQKVLSPYWAVRSGRED